MTYNPSLLKPYLKTKIDNKIPFKNSELYSLCGCENANQKGSIRALKSQIIEESKNSSDQDQNESNESFTFKKSKIYTNPEVKERFHERSQVLKGHVLELINKYPELPLFIYSKIFERVKSEYDRLERERRREYEKNKRVEKEYFLNYSFYDLYIEIFDAINKGKLDQEIKAYMKDVIHSFGNTHTLELEHCEFKLSECEEDDYFGIEDYNWYLEWVLEIIADTMDYFRESFNIKELEYEILKYLFIKSNGDTMRLVSNIVSMRPKELIRSDILKLYILGRRLYPNMESIGELYDEFDLRYSDKLDLAENGINYKGQYEHEFYTDKNGEKCYKSSLEEALIWEREGIGGLLLKGTLKFDHLGEEDKLKYTKFYNGYYKKILKNKPDNYNRPEKEYEPPIPELENELNRLKGSS